jgi:hypothetical protein
MSSIACLAVGSYLLLSNLQFPIVNSIIKK